MKIVMTGGGSGGHITPILAVAHKIKQLNPNTQVIYFGQKGDKFGAIVSEHNIIDGVRFIHAGKFRRYHGQGLAQLLDFGTMRRNMVDSLKVIAGFFESLRLMRQVRPDVVFCKGGYVGVPVGLAAALLRIPYVTHDSDAMPGLANRLIARWAAKHAVAMDVKLYPYPKEKTISVGVPVSGEHKPVSSADKQSFRRSLGIDQYKHIVLVTGGGLGAFRLNQAFVQHAKTLLEALPSTCVIHTTGQLHEKEVSEQYTKLLPKDKRSQVIVRGFVNNIHQYSGAADIVVARGGATSFAELAQQAKPTIIVPNPLLTGGHQLKNAIAYTEKNAAICVTEEQIEEDSAVLVDQTIALLKDDLKQAELSDSIREFAHPDATLQLAKIILSCAADRTGKK